jgi:1-aminocyclopropane-1-carboxylate deaminase
VLDLRLPSPVQEVTGDERLDRARLRLLLKRDDLIHPDFPGNKWRKLRYNIEAAAGRTLLTFGGAYSNHLLATAAAGHHLGFPTIGAVRGEPHDPLNPVLARARAHGMHLHYLNRTDYRTRSEPALAARLHREFGDFHLIPEGGANELGVRGCAEIPAELGHSYDYLACAAGTGTTLAGLSLSSRTIGFAVLKGGAYLADEVRRLHRDRRSAPWSLETAYHFGGYAKTPPPLRAFAADFRARHGVALNEIYEAKMMYGLYELAAAGRFPPGSTVVALLA